MTTERMLFRGIGVLEVEIGREISEGHYEMKIVGMLDQFQASCFFRRSPYSDTWEARCRKCKEIVECNNRRIIRRWVRAHVRQHERLGR